MVSSSVEISKAFLRACLEEYNIHAAAKFLAENVVWFGDSFTDNVSSKKNVLSLLQGKTRMLKTMMQRVLEINLRQVNKLASEVYFVNGHIRLFSNSTFEKTAFSVSMALVEANGEFLINQIHFHAINLVYNDIPKDEQYEGGNAESASYLSKKSFYDMLSNRLSDNGRGCALVFLQLDNAVNIMLSMSPDGFDELLYQIADVVQASTLGNGFCCRLATDAFAIYYPNVQSEYILLERMRSLCAAIHSTDTENNVTTSLGCAYHSTGNVLSEVLISQARTALRRAWKQGGNRFEVYRSEIYEQTEIRALAPVAMNRCLKRVFVRTFGHFDVFVDGKAVHFNSAKSKELLALLIDRKGGFVSASEAITALWENESINDITLARYRKIAMRLKEILNANGIGYIIETIHGNRRIVVDQIDCDYYNYISTKSMNAYTGTYFVDYSWAEDTNAILDAKGIKSS